MDMTKDRTRMRRSQNLRHAHSAATENDDEVTDQTASPHQWDSGEAGSADRRGPPHEEARSRQETGSMAKAQNGGNTLA